MAILLLSFFFFFLAQKVTQRDWWYGSVSTDVALDPCFSHALRKISSLRQKGEKGVIDEVALSERIGVGERR